jgi:hypothetical protein
MISSLVQTLVTWIAPARLPRTEIADDAVTFDGQEATRWFVGVMTACST